MAYTIFSLKFYQSADHLRRTVEAGITSARDAGGADLGVKQAKVMAHAQGAEGIKNAVRAGIHSIEHGIYLDDEGIELMLGRGTFLVPTLLAPLAVLEAAEETGTMPEWGVRKARETIEIHSENVEAGKLADLIITRSDPIADIRSLENVDDIVLVMKDGRVVKDIRQEPK